MTDPRKAAFDGVRAVCPKNPFNDPGNVHAFHNLLDAFGAPRESAERQRRALARPDAFFAAVRSITGALDQVQVDTINCLLSAASHWTVSWLAYGFATAWHEARLKPISEWGKGQGRPYAKLGKYGQPQYGRGLVQLTWDRNYEWADKALGLNGALLKNFDKALEPETATAILVLGMETGAFTGKKLADFLSGAHGTVTQFKEARRIINGMDRADDIAALASRFQTALQNGGWE